MAPVRMRQRRQMPESHRAEDPLLEPIVQLEHGIRQRQGDDDPSPEVAHREEADREGHHDDQADAEDDLDRLRQAVPEAPVAGRDAEHRDRHQVQTPLDEDRAERSAQRGGAVDLEEVGAIEVAELGRNDAVDRPRQEDDLGRVLRADAEARAAQEDGPAQTAQREAAVEDEERDQHEGRVRRGDQPRDL